jgi:hypothetical protein
MGKITIEFDSVKELQDDRETLDGYGLNLND